MSHNKYIYIFLCFFGIAGYSGAQKNFQSIFVKGKVTDSYGGPVRKAVINVIDNGNTDASYYSDNNGNYELTLKNGKVLFLDFTKEKFVTKRIEINTTEVTDDELKYGIFPILLDISLFDDFPGLDKSMLPVPVSKLSFSDYEGDFITDKTYLESSTVKINNILAQLKQLKNAAYEKEIAVADEFLKEKKYEYSWMTYLRANEILPEKQYPKEQITNIKKTISELISADEAYNRNIERADKNYHKKSYKISRGYYEKSLLYRPQDPYPVKRIGEIEEILAGSPELQAILEKDDAVADIFSEPATTSLNKDSSLITADTHSGTGNKQNSTTDRTAVSDLNSIQQSTINDKNFTGDNSSGFISIPIAVGLDVIEPAGKDEKEKLLKLTELLKKYTAENDFVNQAKVHEAMGLVNYRSGNYESALSAFEKAGNLVKTTGNKEHEAILAETLANISEQLYRYDAAAGWYEKTASLLTESSQIPRKSEMLMRLGDMKFASGKHQDAITSYLSSLSYDTDFDTDKDVSPTLNNIGAVYYEMGKWDEALCYFRKSEKMSESKNNNKEYAMSLNNVGNIEYEWHKYNEALALYLKSVDIKIQINHKTGLAVTLHNIGNVFKKTGNYGKAMVYYNRSSAAGRESGSNDIVYKNYLLISELFAAQKNCDKALEYYKLYAQYKHLISDNSMREQISETGSYYRMITDRDRQLALLRQEVKKQKLLSWYESQKRIKEVAFLNDIIKLKKSQIETREAQMANQKLLIWVSLAGILLLIALTFTLWLQRNIKKRANILLREQNEEINSQKEEIMAQRDEIFGKNREITDSIKYARRIQNAILPSDTLLNQLLPENFVFFRPRDIVSGDFYWISSVGNKVAIAVADCTGHGVPGAFMSVMGFSLLGQVVNELSGQNAEIKASDVLDKLRLYIIAALHQTGEIGEARDGLDMSFCIYDKQENILQFSGANTYLYKYGSDDFKMFKGDRMPVSFFRKKELPFTNHIINVKQGEMVYLATDGITDQFGGSSGKKFRQEALRNLFVEIYSKPLELQKKELEYALGNWMGNFNQVDDILVIGLKIV